MGKTCCVPNCQSNYKKIKNKQQEDKLHVSVYRFPKDPVEKNRWKDSIPRVNLVINEGTVVCKLHWPKDAKFVSKNGKLRPADPPSLFPNIPPSCVPNVSKPRTTSKCLSSVRNIEHDELEKFMISDKISYLTFLNDLNQRHPTLLV